MTWYGSSHRTERHSYPTRRSSDLYYEMVGTRGIWHKGWKAATMHAPVPSDQGNFPNDRWQLFDVGKDRSDRKSTRLNSSHLVISYAVFCLKKKKHANSMYTA